MGGPSLRSLNHSQLDDIYLLVHSALWCTFTFHDELVGKICFFFVSARRAVRIKSYCTLPRYDRRIYRLTGGWRAADEVRNLRSACLPRRRFWFPPGGSTSLTKPWKPQRYSCFLPTSWGDVLMWQKPKHVSAERILGTNTENRDGYGKRIRETDAENGRETETGNGNG